MVGWTKQTKSQDFLVGHWFSNCTCSHCGELAVLPQMFSVASSSLFSQVQTVAPGRAGKKITPQKKGVVTMVNLGTSAVGWGDSIHHTSIQSYNLVFMWSQARQQALHLSLAHCPNNLKCKSFVINSWNLPPEWTDSPCNKKLIHKNLPEPPNICFFFVSTSVSLSLKCDFAELHRFNNETYWVAMCCKASRTAQDICSDKCMLLEVFL